MQTSEWYPDYRKLVLDNHLRRYINNKEGLSHTLDYLIGDLYIMYRNKKQDQAESLRITKLNLQLKNAIMYFIVRNREATKQQSLTKMLEQVIARKAKKMEELRKKREFSLEDLDQDVKNTMLATQLEEIETLISKTEESLTETDLQFQILRKKCEKLFRPPKTRRQRALAGAADLVSPLSEVEN